MTISRTVSTRPSSPTPVQVTMRRAEVDPTPDQALWVVIRNSADALSYDNYAAFIEPIMGGSTPPGGRGRFGRVSASLQLPFPDAEPYRLLKVATEVFMMANTGVVIGQTKDDLDITRATKLENADLAELTRRGTPDEDARC